MKMLICVTSLKQHEPVRYTPTNKMVIFPPVTQLKDKLLPEVPNSPQPTVVIVDQTHTQSQTVGQAVAGGGLQLVEKVLQPGKRDQ